MSGEVKLPRLELWEWDGKYFIGRIYGAECSVDGDVFSTEATFIDWPASRFMVGNQTIELGAHKSELLNSEQDVGSTEQEFPW